MEGERKWKRNLRLTTQTGHFQVTQLPYSGRRKVDRNGRFPRVITEMSRISSNINQIPVSHVVMIILIISGLTNPLRSQCNLEPVPTTQCNDAPSLCYNGRCYTTRLVSSAGNNDWCGLNTAVHNPDYFTFKAASSTVQISILVNKCDGGGCGLQSAILDACPWENEDVLSCDPGKQANGIMTLEYSGMEEGKQYWLMIDGCSGELCEYEFVSLDGVYHSHETIIDTVVSSTFLYDGMEYGPGIYQVMKPGNEECDSTVTLRVRLDEIVVFPNPGTGNFGIFSPDAPPDEVRIFDLLGREVGYSHDNEYGFSIENPVSGVYLLLIEVDGQRMVRIVHVR